MSLPSAAVPFRAFLRRDWAVARSYRLPFLMGLVGSMFILVIIFQTGKLISPGAGGPGSQLGRGYFSFAVLGTVVIQIVHTATQSFATKLREEQTTGTLEAILTSPTPPATLILGSGLYDIARSVVEALVVLLIAAGLGLRVELSGTWLALSLLVFLGLLALAMEVGILVATFTVVFKRGASPSGLINAGLALLAGAWYPVSSLPAAVRVVAELIPFTWGLTALRDALLFGRLDPARLAGLLALAVAGIADRPLVLPGRGGPGEGAGHARPVLMI